jgi:very-short-patch-repair endonuclease
MRVPRIPLSDEFGSRPFNVRAARAAGWGEGRLRGPDLQRPFHGVRPAAPTDAEAAYAPRFRPGDRFSHTSAGRIWGIPLPHGFDDVHVSSADPSRVRATGVIGHRSHRVEIVSRHGLPVSDPASTFRELASLLSISELVAAGDHLVLEPRILDPLDVRPYITLDELTRRLREPGGRGIRRARAALDLVRVGAESPQETRLRLLARDAGLPEPVLQFELRDRRGRRIGAFDLAWPEARLIAEYDGDQHRTSTSQYERDIERFDRAAEEGWLVIRVRMAGLAGRAGVTRRRLVEAYRSRHSVEWPKIDPR